MSRNMFMIAVAWAVVAVMFAALVINLGVLWNLG